MVALVKTICTCEFLKRRGIYWLVERVQVSQEGLCSMTLDHKICFLFLTYTNFLLRQLYYHYQSYAVRLVPGTELGHTMSLECLSTVYVFIFVYTAVRLRVPKTVSVFMKE